MLNRPVTASSRVNDMDIALEQVTAGIGDKALKGDAAAFPQWIERDQRPFARLAYDSLSFIRRCEQLAESQPDDICDPTQGEK